MLHYDSFDTICFNVFQVKNRIFQFVLNWICGHFVHEM